MHAVANDGQGEEKSQISPKNGRFDTLYPPVLTRIQSHISQSIHLFLFPAQIKVTPPPLTSPNTFAPQGYPHNQTAQASKEAVPVVHLLSCFTLHQLHELVSSTTPAARIWSFVIVIVLLRDQICESLLISLGSALVLQQHLHFSETPLLQAF